MFGVGMSELLLILVLVLAVFGAGKLPEIGGLSGRGIGSFRRALHEKEPIEVVPTDGDRTR